MPPLIRGLAVGLRAIVRSLRGRPTLASPGQAERWQQWYFDTGVAYYVTARMAYFARAIPVSGNLFHHALEMFLKGYLCLTVDEWGRRSLRHNLRRTWRRFKVEVKDANLDRFDEAIRAIDHFEQLRYPEGLPTYTIQFQLMGPFIAVSGQYAPPRKRQFQLAVNDVDELIAAIFSKASFDPQFCLARLSVEARAVLQRDNPTGIW
jgi:hypothetical protein